MTYPQRCQVRSVRTVADNVAVLRFSAPAIASSTRPGQFVNIRVHDLADPLLRRPFSVYHTDGDDVEIVFHVIGKGTALLGSKREGDTVDVIGPLGVPFSTGADDFSTGVLVAGGLGVAPMPMLTAALRARGVRVLTLLGARTRSLVVQEYLDQPLIATDDGTRGFHGTVVDLLTQVLHERRPERPRVFACGPNPMLRSLARVALERRIPCEVSLEGPMGCGFGICQGCAVELVDQPRRFALMCTEGPAFDVRKIRIPA